MVGVPRSAGHADHEAVAGKGKDRLRPLWRSLRAQIGCLVGDTGLEPVTSCMSSKCSNQLS
jgi:hypothetical protein